ncbi:hypothetical protein BGZ82_006831 [Podila clonocystis]|nr:hypothetical protein BGZ82_006831 [Podila clonocystis]
MRQEKSPTTPPKNPSRLHRPAVHFLQPPDQWGNIQQYIRSSRPQSVQSHHARYMNNLKLFVKDGTEEEQNVAKVLMRDVTEDDMLRASLAVDRSTKEDIIQAGSNRFTDKAVAAVEASLGSIADRFQSDVIEAARGGTKRRVPRRTTSPTIKGKDVLMEEEQEQPGASDDEDEDSDDTKSSVASDEDHEDSDEDTDTVGEDESEEEKYGERDLDHLLPLNQELGWFAGKKNILAIFFQFKRKNIGNKYSLSKDSIADLATIGEFANSLGLRTFQAVMQTLPKLTKDNELSATLNLILPAPETTFEEATDNIRGMDHRKALVHLINLCLDPMKFYQSPGVQTAVNERQYFVDLVLPCFRQLFWLFGLNMAILETQVLGCARRLNAGRIPLIEKVVIANFADAVVAHNGVQPVLAECGRPNDPNHDKRFSDHYKLARDLKDTWAHCIEDMIVGAKVPPRNVKVFGVQVYQQQVELYCLDFNGCFRLMQLASFAVPRCGAKGFAKEFRRMVVVCHGFAKMVADEVKRWDRAPYWEDEGDCQVAEKVLGYLPNTTPKPRKSPKNKRRREDDDDDE